MHCRTAGHAAEEAWRADAHERSLQLVWRHGRQRGLAAQHHHHATSSSHQRRRSRHLHA